MKFKAEKLLPKEKLSSKATNWQRQADLMEASHSSYYSGYVDRVEGHPKESKDIAEQHDVSFLNEIIPKFIERKKKGEKVKILDLGGGVGDFANQIRKKFGDKVEVFTTGIKKKTVREFKKNRFKKSHRNPNIQQPLNIPLSLHPNDLKWRSIRELSDFPEFDLIIDTMGEQTYQSFNDESRLESFMGYIRAIAKKLRTGGEAYISPSIHFEKINYAYSQLINELKNELGISIDITSSALKVTKL